MLHPSSYKEISLKDDELGTKYEYNLTESGATMSIKQSPTSKSIGEEQTLESSESPLSLEYSLVTPRKHDFKQIVYSTSPMKKHSETPGSPCSYHYISHNQFEKPTVWFSPIPVLHEDYLLEERLASRKYKISHKHNPLSHQEFTLGRVCKWARLAATQPQIGYSSQFYFQNYGQLHITQWGNKSKCG